MKKSKILFFPFILMNIIVMPSIKISEKNYENFNEFNSKFIKQISAGYLNSSMVISNGEKDDLYLWGSNEFNQIIDTESENIEYLNKPFLFDLPIDGKIKDVEIGRDDIFVIMIDHDGNEHLYGWGVNKEGQLGLGNHDTKFEPTEIKIPIEGEIKHFSAGYDSSAIVINDGTKDHLYTWGNNNYGQLGLGEENDKNNILSPLESNLPIQNAEIKLIDFGYYHSLIVLNDGDKDYLYSCGNNSNGSLGLGDKYNNITIVNNWTKVDFPNHYDKITSISSMGEDSSSAVVRDGSYNFLYTWGYNNHGQLGTGDEENKNTPQKLILPSTGRKKVLLSDKFSFVLVDDVKTQSLYSWGWNSEGQLGVGDTEDRYEPTKIDIPITGEIKDFTIGSDFGMVLVSDSKEVDHLYSWGYNGNGQLGLGTNFKYSYLEPQEIITSVFFDTKFNSKKGVEEISIYESLKNDPLVLKLELFGKSIDPNGILLNKEELNVIETSRNVNYDDWKIIVTYSETITDEKEDRIFEIKLDSFKTPFYFKKVEKILILTSIIILVIAIILASIFIIKKSKDKQAKSIITGFGK